MQSFVSSSILLKSFWFVAIPISILFLIQTLVFLTGLDITDQSENYNSILNEEENSFHFFSLKSLIHFLFAFSWTGILSRSFTENSLSLFVVSIAAGILFVFLCAYMIRIVQLLRTDKSFRIQHAVNQNAEVCLTIPENKNGKGKIKVVVKGIAYELEAVSEKNKIESGAIVKVEKIADSILVVKPLKEDSLKAFNIKETVVSVLSESE